MRPRLVKVTSTPRWLIRQAKGSRINLSVLLLVVTVLATVVIEPSTLNSSSADLLLSPGLPLMFAALAEMTVILVGDFDLSVGYAVGLCNILSATLLVSNPLLGALSLIGMIVAYVGLGLLAELTKVPAIVITLGSSFIWLGIGLIAQPVPGGSAPGWLEAVGNASLPVVPEPLYLLVGSAALMWWLIARSRLGLRMRALGNSRKSLDDSGWSARRTRLASYAVAGLCVVLAGLFTTVVSQSSDINSSGPITLTTFVVVIIGGCRFGVGRVEAVGVVLAATFLTLLTSLMAFYNVAPIYTTGIEGVIIVAGVTVPWALRSRFHAREGT